MNGRKTSSGTGQPRPREVADSTVLVVGMGSIGREFAARAKAMGMRILAIRENPSKGLDGADAVYGSSQIDEVLPQADYVLLCTPVTPATTGLMNAARLGKMKPDAYLINVARGPLIDEPALLDALQKHRIGGAPSMSSMKNLCQRVRLSGRSTTS